MFVCVAVVVHCDVTLCVLTGASSVCLCRRGRAVPRLHDGQLLRRRVDHQLSHRLHARCLRHAGCLHHGPRPGQCAKFSITCAVQFTTPGFVESVAFTGKLSLLLC